MSANIKLDNGVITGPMRQPRNQHQTTAGSIHNDAVAKPLGFRGGTVAGIIHHEQFAPLMLEAFGQRWFEQGSLSMYYLNATTDEENVQAFATAPPEGTTNAQIDVWLEQEDGPKVLEGTASVGAVDETKTCLYQRYEARRAPGETRILAEIEPGIMLPEIVTRVDMTEQLSRRDVATEGLDWYWGDSPWGGPICTPVTMFRLLNEGLKSPGKIAKAVGLYGAIEVRVYDGPLMVEKEYKVQGKILAKGETPKSEYLWWGTELKDAESGDRVAGLLMMTRWMKLSSELWRESA